MPNKTGSQGCRSKTMGEIQTITINQQNVNVLDIQQFSNVTTSHED